MDPSDHGLVVNAHETSPGNRSPFACGDPALSDLCNPGAAHLFFKDKASRQNAVSLETLCPGFGGEA